MFRSFARIVSIKTIRSCGGMPDLANRVSTFSEILVVALFRTRVEIGTNSFTGTSIRYVFSSAAERICRDAEEGGEGRERGRGRGRNVNRDV